MSNTRPCTPGATPRRPLSTSSRPVSRASSRPTSPVKASSATESVNNPASPRAPRPSSSLALHSSARAGSRTSSSSGDGGKRAASPTKTTSSLRSARPALADPFSSTTSIHSITVGRAAGGGGSGPGSLFRQRDYSASTRSSDASCSNGGDTTDDDREREDDCVPRRKAGFGPLTSPTKRTMRRTDPHETETEGEGGFLTAEEGALASFGRATTGARAKLRDSIIEKSEDEDDGETATETEEVEDDRDGKKENVVVCLRVRPAKQTSSLSEIYRLVPSQAMLSLAASHPTLLKRGGKTSDEYDFRFDLLHCSPDPTSKLYDRKIRPVVKAALNGFNGTVFAYGQTASGKTHTMMGSSSEPGIIPLAIDELFSYIHKQNTHRTYSLRVSFLEIYNEQLRDLLAPSVSSASLAGSRQPEIVEGGTVKNLEERPVSMPQQVLEVLREGEQRRRVGQTDWNERSSRSHCVFIVTIESMSKSEDGSARTSRLNLIDLAGSESATGQEERRKEGSFINKSLLTLGTVIGKLTEPHHSTAHIPYRDSKLTRLLQPALSGNSRVAVVCTISPDVEQATETLSTLKFAKRAKMVVTKAERGLLVTDQMMLKQYAAQVERLRLQIESVEAGDVVRERDLAARRADEAERKGKEARDALAEKDLELARLRSQLAQTQSLILTGPSLEANARRVSGSFAGSMLSPSRSRSLNLGGGRREGVEIGGIGLGTPSRGLASRNNGLLEISNETMQREKEASLALQLEEATAKLASLSTTETELVDLRAELQQLQEGSLRVQLDAAQQAQANADQRDRIGELETDLATVREELRAVEEDRDRLSEELRQCRTEVEGLREDNKVALATIGGLKAVEEQLLSAEVAVQAKDAELHKLHTELSSVNSRLAKTDAASRLPDPKDETIASFERQVESIKQELSIISAAKSEAVQAALDEVAGIKKERDLALTAMEEAERRIQQVEEMAELQAKRHETVEEQSIKEKEAATSALQADIDRLKEDLVAKISRVAHLERTVEGLESLEARRKKYEADQRSGLDKLKSRMDDMRAKSSAPPSSQRPVLGSSSTLTSSGVSASLVGHSDMTDKQEQHVKELQVRNGELLAKVSDLQRAVDAGLGQLEKRALEGTIEEQKMTITSTEARAEDWKQKYLAAQRLLDKLASKPHLGALPSTSRSENDRPTPLGELKLASPFSRMTLSSSTTSLRPSLNFVSTGLARAPTTRTSRDPLPPRPASPSPALSASSAWNHGSQPPPLPSSPHQRSSSTKERNIRRKTIAKDLVNLQASKVVDQRREGFDSPTSSPTKADLERGARGVDGTTDGFNRASVDLFGARERKSSWE
ncbi:hypothetical protein JCM11491_006164 [Sporobolomyces phaffii]